MNTTATPDTEKRWKAKPLDDRIKTAVKLLEDALGELDENPNWFEDCLTSLLYKSAWNLSEYLLTNEEERRQGGVTLHLTVDFDWTSWEQLKAGKEPDSLLVVSGRLTEENMKDPEAATKALAETFDKHVELVLLGELTNGIWSVHGPENKPNSYTAVFPPELIAELEAMNLSDEDFKEALFDLSQPFVAATGLDEATMEEAFGGSAHYDHGRTFTIEAQGETLKGTVILEVYPLHVDEVERHAYFPVAVGLLWHGRESVDLNTWSQSELEDLVGVVEPLFLPPPDLSGILAQAEKVDTTKDKLVPGPLPEGLTPRRLILEAPTRIDRNAYGLVNATTRLSLPRKWGAVQSWEDLVEEEKARLLDNYGEATAIREKLLVRKHPPGKPPTLELTTRAEDELMDAKASTWVRRVYKVAGLPREHIVRRLRVGAGYVEARLTWFGTTWPLVSEGLNAQEKQLRAVKKELRQQPLFEDLDHNLREAVDNRLRFLAHVRDGYEVMKLILHELGRQGTNPVKIPAYHFRSLLECEQDIHGHARIRGCLEALHELSFNLTVNTHDNRHDAFGNFLAQVAYEGRGPGEHTDGDWWLQVGDAFIGCLKVFEIPGHKLRDMRDVTEYDFGKKLTKDEAAGLNYIRGWSTAPWFDKAKGHTPEQANLRTWIETNLTTNVDTPRKDRQHHKVKKAAANAHELREYRSDFCPLLPEGTPFYGALGHSRRHPENGWKLVQAATQPTKTGGAKYEGIMSILGYEYPPGQAYRRRENNVRQALQDMKAVVEDAFHGLVVARFGGSGEWATLPEAIDKWTVDELAKKALWFFFLPTNYRELARDAIEAHHAERYARGETPYELAITRDAALFEKGLDERGRPVPKEEDLEGGDAAQPLRSKLKVARLERDLRQADVAGLFGVSQPAYAPWESGTKPIPAELVPLVERWVATGEPPTEDELASRKSRRPGLDEATGAGGRGRKKPPV